MNLLFSILALLSGSGVFIAGMNMMGDGLEKSAGKGMKKLIGTVSNNRFSGVLVGAGVTGIIQSSAATTVMAIGFVNAGIMTLMQAAPIIMGANIGTTVTGVIVSLKSLNISAYASLLAFIGVMMTFIKKDGVKNVGSILCGLGIIFIGLDLMSAAFEGEEMKSFFIKVFKLFNFPLLLILIGMVFTALIQSSSASTGIVIIMVGQGALSLDNALFIVLGSNIGTCITAILASIGTSTNAKRTSLIHLTFNLVGTVIFTSLIWPLSSVAVNILQSVVDKPEMQIAWFHVIFNVTTTVLLLPFTKWLVKFSELIIKDKPQEGDNLKLKFVDELLLKTPPIALMQCKKEIDYMIKLAKDNIELSRDAILTGDKELSLKIAENEKIINFTNKTLTKFLIKLAPLLSTVDEKVLGGYFHVLNDVERIGDHAENFYEIGEEMAEKEFSFSPNAKEDLLKMFDEVVKMFNISFDIFENLKAESLRLVSEKEELIDELKRQIEASHVARLAKGACKVELSPYLYSTVAGLERVADHLVNVSYSILNPTGSQQI